MVAFSQRANYVSYFLILEGKSLVQLTRLLFLILTVNFTIRQNIHIFMYIFVITVNSNYQYIPFPVPEYLAQFLAFKLNTKIRRQDGLVCVSVTRHAELGKMILQHLSKDSRRVTKKTEGVFFLKVSNFAGANSADILRGDRHLLRLDKKSQVKIIETLKADFEESLLNYVAGAEFAHKKNGWSPVQKRKGIRKHAINEFCKKNKVNPDKRSFDSLFKMIQRRMTTPRTAKTKALHNIVLAMSF